ncbi:IclR family transcriptional regulator [Corynebacterium auriscanis]|uniref:IclR family transcriptional regulator n=1 Tax=Corynebacterium auriscanis TaxID=99807 RepID=A0A0A2DKC2_9CORY|nr:IclR family transcriptional regulator [Corynebacterium auriscanis]KGM18354.1 IclR family transcriptional regulator [Corynebacterium auriscanis]WJY72958.1 HTH-type transcriptional regulator KipR [Corynebacterium auriscanis]
MGNDVEVPNTSGIQVLDRAVYLLNVIAARPSNLTQLCELTGLPRATTHRIAVALEKHRLIQRDEEGRWRIGQGVIELAPRSSNRLLEAADEVLPELVKEVGEAVQVYRRSGFERVCVAAISPSAGLHDIVPAGHRMTLAAGSAAKVLVAYGTEDLRREVLPTAAYDRAELDQIRTQGWAESVAERDVSLASCSVPILDAGGGLVAVLSTSGPVDRLRPSPADRYKDTLLAGAKRIGELL